MVKYHSVAGRRQQNVVKKDRAVCDNKLPGFKTLQNLNFSIFEHADIHVLLDKMLPI